MKKLFDMSDAEFGRALDAEMDRRLNEHLSALDYEMDRRLDDEEELDDMDYYYLGLERQTQGGEE